MQYYMGRRVHILYLSRFSVCVLIRFVIFLFDRCGEPSDAKGVRGDLHPRLLPLQGSGGLGARRLSAGVFACISIILALLFDFTLCSPSLAPLSFVLCTYGITLVVPDAPSGAADHPHEAPASQRLEMLA